MQPNDSRGRSWGGSAKHQQRAVGTEEQSLRALHCVTCRAHPEHCAQTQHEGFLQPKRSPGERKRQTKGQEPMAAVGGMRTQRMQAYITRSGQTAAPRSRGQPSPATPDLLATEQAAAQSQHVPAVLREHTHTAPGCPEQEFLAGREQLDFLKDNNPFKHSTHPSKQSQPRPSGAPKCQGRGAGETTASSRAYQRAALGGGGTEDAHPHLQAMLHPHCLTEELSTRLLQKPSPAAPMGAAHRAAGMGADKALLSCRPLPRCFQHASPFGKPRTYTHRLCYPVPKSNPRSETVQEANFRKYQFICGKIEVSNSGKSPRAVTRENPNTQRSTHCFCLPGTAVHRQ